VRAIVPLSVLLYVSLCLFSIFIQSSIIIEQVETPITWISMLTSPPRSSRLLSFCDSSHHFSNRKQYLPCRISKWLISRHRIVAPFFKDLSSSIERGVKHLQPLIEERRRQRTEYGIDHPDKPVGFLPKSIVISSLSCPNRMTYSAG